MQITLTLNGARVAEAALLCALICDKGTKLGGLLL